MPSGDRYCRVLQCVPTWQQADEVVVLVLCTVLRPKDSREVSNPWSLCIRSHCTPKIIEPLHLGKSTLACCWPCSACWPHTRPTSRQPPHNSGHAGPGGQEHAHSQGRAAGRSAVIPVGCGGSRSGAASAAARRQCRQQKQQRGEFARAATMRADHLWTGTQHEGGAAEDERPRDRAASQAGGRGKCTVQGCQPAGFRLCSRFSVTLVCLILCRSTTPPSWRQSPPALRAWA